jgi:hypothetical protein
MAKYRRFRNSRKRFRSNRYQRSKSSKTKIPSYRRRFGRQLSAQEIIHQALHPVTLKFPGTPMQFRRQEPGW